MHLYRTALSALCLLVVLPSCGNRIIRPFKKRPHQGQKQERPERPSPPPPSTGGSEPAEPPPPPPAQPPAEQPVTPPLAAGSGSTGLAPMPVLPPSRLPQARGGGEWFEVSVPPLGFTDGPTNLAKIFRTGPAGRHGFLTVKGEDFVFQDGTVFELWGTNITRGAAAPTKEEAPKIARQLSRLGYNAVRFHLIDSAQLLFKGSTSISQFNAQMLDRLDYLIAELKKEGIYFNINLHVWRIYGNKDPVPDPRGIPEKGRYVNYFYPDVQKLEKDYSRRLLNHKNRYTGLSYAEDPAMCMVELTNENTLFKGWMSGLLDEGSGGKRGLTKAYRDWLDKDFGRWLKQKYRDNNALRAAWNQGAKKGQTGLASSENLSRGTVRRTPGKKINRYTKVRIEDTARYYYFLETKFIDDFRNFLRKELKVKIPVLGTQNYTGLPGLAAQAEADWVDLHCYWDHPQFKDAKRNQPLMKAHLKSLVQNPIIEDKPGPGGRVSLFTETNMSRVAGKPFTISEWAPSKVNPQGWEMPLIFGAYNAFHGTDGMFSFAFANNLDSYTMVPMKSHVQWSNVPPFLAMNAVAALAWRRGDVSPAKERIELHYSTDDIFDVANAANRNFLWWGKKVPSWVPLQVPIARVLHSKGRDSGPLELLRSKNTKLYRSSTGELTWDVRNKADAHVLIDTPRYQAVIGSLRNPAAAKNLAISGQGRASVSVISLDNSPLAKTKHALLTTISDYFFQGEKVERSGAYQVWNPGKLPLKMRAVRANLRLVGWSNSSKLTCYALDLKGGRAAEVPIQISGNEAVIRLDAFPYIWFELVAE